MFLLIQLLIKFLICGAGIKKRFAEGWRVQGPAGSERQAPALTVLHFLANPQEFIHNIPIIVAELSTFHTSHTIRDYDIFALSFGESDRQE